MRGITLKFHGVKFLSGIPARNYYISTPIFYVNAFKTIDIHHDLENTPHIGHLYSAVIADSINRFKFLTGVENSIFSTGTDEHGLKVEIAAKKGLANNVNLKSSFQQHRQANKDKLSTTSKPTLEYCTKVSSEFHALFKKCNVNFSDFIRTTDPRHLSTVNKLWKRLQKNGHIYEGFYSGWYCVSDEAFLKQSQLKELKGDEGKTVMVSAESGHPAEWTEEKNYMFRMSSFKDDLLYWLKDSKKYIYTSKLHTMIEEVSLGDLSISRPIERIHWGIPVPGDPSQCIYVWVDALANYLTVAKVFDDDSEGNELNLKNWPPDIQVIGKDILKFHGIYWPSLLIAAGLEPPKSLFVHSHWTVDGEKMSKSRGNVVDPFDRADAYTPDGLRYFLLREGVAHSDGNYSDKKIVNILNSELADTFGNLLNRCTGKSLNPNQEFPSLKQSDIDKLYKSNDQTQSETCEKLLESLTALPDKVRIYYSSQEFHRVADAVMEVLRITNKFFEAQRPWDTAKRLKMLYKEKDRNDALIDTTQAELNAILSLSMESLRICGIILQPMIPVLSSTLLDRLGVSITKRMWTDASEFSWLGAGKNGNPLDSKGNVPLFMRIIKVFELKALDQVVG
ncbi:hypothetical protein J437_LFUL014405 [Ladona fulva]|uniref:Methionine--tRNA ligase, mitochondrial n=1 Tax=Ladona fulva TaxID=123851 RepID=A0A8K0NXK2_LADFU|nr:hypothetical protein J437_LFUL014405 [Ladona fulva]